MSEGNKKSYADFYNDILEDNEKLFIGYVQDDQIEVRLVGWTSEGLYHYEVLIWRDGYGCIYETTMTSTNMENPIKHALLKSIDSYI